MFRPRLSVLFAASLLFVYASFAAEPPPVSDALKAIADALPPEAKPQELRRAESGATYALLPNGCEIVIVEKHSAPVLTVQAWVRTGSIDENKWMGAGISHFCEHMLFKGTTKRPTGVLDQEIRGAGGDDNAYTSYERTTYHMTAAAEGFDTAFAALADMLMDSTMPPDEAKKEHGVVYKEIERSINTPDSVLNDVFQRLIYQVHPYGVPVLGYPDRFKEVTPQDVFAYYQQRYSPQMCTFIAVGDVDTAKILPTMAKTLGAWKRKSVDPVAIPEEPPQVAPRSVRVTHPLCEIPKIMLGFPSVSLRDKDLYALDLLANILGDGRASRLYQNVKDKQKLVLDISAFDYTPMYPGYFGVMATAEEQKVDAAKNEILKVLESIKTTPPSADELARAKRKAFTQHVFTQMTVEGLAEDIGSGWFQAGDLDFSAHYTERMQAVTADDVVRVAKMYLVPEKLNVAIMGCEPKGEKAEGAPAKTAAPVEQGKVGAERMAAELDELKKNPNVDTPTLLADKAVFEFTLKPSGVRVVLKEDHSLPVINLSIAALGGTRWEPADLAGSGNLMAEMLDRGTEKRNKLQISQQSEDLGASLSAFSGKNSFGVAVSGLKQDAPKLVELASECMLQPSFLADEFDALKADTLQRIAEEDESLFALAGKVIRPLLYGSHPYSRQVLGTAESVKKVTPEDLKKLHQALVHPENLAIGIVGDLNVAETVQLVNAFSTLKTGEFKAPAVPPMPHLEGGKTGEAEKPNITNDVLELGFRGVDLKNPDREILDLLAADLSGLGGRFFVAIREKQGSAYTVGVNNDSQLDGGSIVFFIQTDPAHVDRSLETMWDQVKQLRAEEIPQKELDSVKSYMSGTEAIELQNQSDLAQRLALSQLYHEGAAYMFGRRARLADVTPAQVKAAAVKYLDPNNWAKALLKPK
jgi:zinc protease